MRACQQQSGARGSGIYDSVDIDDYHTGPGLSASDLKLIQRSPAHYLEAKQNPSTPTPAMTIGSAFHTGVLEPDQFNDRYILRPDRARRSKVDREWWEEWEQEHADLTPLKRDEWDRVHTMSMSIANHPTAPSLLAHGQPEQTVYWTDNRTGELCKCRPDWLDLEGNLIVDLKSTPDASPDAFARSCARYGYALQAVYYLDGVRHHAAVESFVLIAGESARPHAIGLYVLDDDALGLGKAQYRAALDAFAVWKQGDNWAGYPCEVQALSLPGWAFPR